jgi:NADPH:quinone reductase-like Zn-dependent oxidoreductase
MARGKSFAGALSDAGVVETVGAGALLKPGDRVTGSFFEGWLGGEPVKEDAQQSRRRTRRRVVQYRVRQAAALVRTPDHLSDVEAASLPCAGLTAWSAVIKLGGIKPGQTVLTQGTGGVSIFALQFAKMSGARDCDLLERGQDRVEALGADVTINYKTTE